MSSKQLTPLHGIRGFSEPVCAALAKYWITSAEEFVATAKLKIADDKTGRQALSEELAPVAPDVDVGQLSAAAEEKLGELGISFSTPAPALRAGTGARLRDEERDYEASFSLPKKREHSLLPPAEQPWPAQDQGEANTCVPFALVAAYQLTTGQLDDLSERFLFWAATCAEARPDPKGGVVVEDALDALANLGVCLEELWPLAGVPLEELLKAPPDDVKAEAARRRSGPARLLDHRSPVAIQVAIEAGTPVVLILPTFRSWYESRQMVDFGKVRKPLPGEQPRPGASSDELHAICAVGFRADPMAPGGGYFVVRNSWGGRWGKEAAEGPGYGYVPYDFKGLNIRRAIALTPHPDLPDLGRAAAEPALPPRQGAPTPATLAAARAAIERLGALNAALRERLDASDRELAELAHLLSGLAGAAPGLFAGAAQPDPRLWPSPHPSGAAGLVGAHVLVLEDERDRELSPWLVGNGIEVKSGLPLLSLTAGVARDLVRAAEKPTTPEDESVMYARRHEHDAPNRLGIHDRYRYADLASAGWALVVSAADDARLIEALWPLLEQRLGDQKVGAEQAPPFAELTRPVAGETCEQWLRRQGVNPFEAMLNAPRVPVLLYTPPMLAETWLSRHHVQAATVDPSNGVPFYLLIAGRPGPLSKDDRAFIPFKFQYDLDLIWGVGRVCFTDADGDHDFQGYADYARRLVAFERQPPPLARKITYFAPRHELDPATVAGQRELVLPLAEGVAGRRDPIAKSHGFTTELLLDGDATRERMLALLREPDPAARSALLFISAHGAGLSLDSPNLAAHQGAIICNDWSGIGPVSRDHYLAGEDLERTDLNVEGMIVFTIACYGVGCPSEDQFVAPGTGKKLSIAPHDLVAQLPQRLLRRGALAVLGHVDRAWTHGFRTKDGVAYDSQGELIPQEQAFSDVLSKAMRGKRLGYVTDEFNRVQADRGRILTNLMIDLMEGTNNVGSDEHIKTYGRAWTAYQDMRSYVLFGDPAARLPFFKPDDDKEQGW